MRASSACATMLLLILLAFGTAFAGSISDSIAALTIRQTDHPAGMDDAAERKYGPIWCQKHSRKCTKMGGLMPS
jgi:hypothetical protein